MNVILRIEMMDAFGVDSVFEGRHRAMMAHPPVSKAATMDSSSAHCDPGRCHSIGQEPPNTENEAVLVLRSLIDTEAYQFPPLFAECLAI